MLHGPGWYEFSHLLDVLYHDVLYVCDRISRAIDCVRAGVMREEVLRCNRKMNLSHLVSFLQSVQRSLRSQVVQAAACHCPMFTVSITPHAHLLGTAVVQVACNQARERFQTTFSRLTMRCASAGAKASFNENASADAASLECASKKRCRTSSRNA